MGVWLSFLIFLALSAFHSAEASEDSSKAEKSEPTILEQVTETTLEYGEKAYEATKDVVKKTNRKLGTSRENRINKDHALFFNYSFFDTWIPSKYGIAYSYIPSESDTWELDWNHSSLSLNLFITDLGKMSEDRIALMRKSYSKRNSFYLGYGVNYYSFDAYLGEKFFANMGNAPTVAIDLVQISSLGLSFSLGNRWHFKNWVIGFDWFTVHVPVVILESKAPYLEYTNNESDRKTVEDVIDTLKHIPTFSALKFQVGYSF